MIRAMTMVLYLRCQHFEYFREMTNLVTKTVAVLSFVLVVFGGSYAQESAPAPVGARVTSLPARLSVNDTIAAERQIRQVLDTQTEAWNRGDVEGFMAGYWNSPELTFYSNGTETKGWQPTLDRYKKHYQGEGRAMGKLDFPSQMVTILSPDTAVVRGKWHLKMPDGKEPQGMFTLVLRRIPNEGWKIVHDHSSGE